MDADKQVARAQKELKQASPIEDPYSKLLNQLVRQIPNFQKLVEEPAERGRKTLLSELSGETFEGQAAAEALERLIGVLEGEIETIASSHSRAYWLFLTRRLDPDPIGDSSAWTVALYRNVLNLAIVKYGFAEPPTDEFELIGDESLFGGPRLVPKDFEPKDAIDTCRLEFLAHELNAAATAFRRVGKGAVLRPVGDDWYVTDASEKIESLMRLRDRRSERYGDLTGIYGAVAKAYTEDLTDENAPFELGLPTLNAKRRGPQWITKLTGVEVAGPTAFVLASMNTAEMRAILKQFETDVTAAVGATPDALLASLWAISIHWIRVAQENPLVLIQLAKTGYHPFSSSGEKFDRFVENHARYVAAWWSEVRGEELDDPKAREIFIQAIEAMTYSEETISEISLWNRLPFRMVIPADTGDRLFLDLSAAGEFLSDVFREIGFIEGSAANLKAANFEEEVARQAHEAGLRVWEQGKELITSDGGRREIDVAIIIGTTLYVIECKAFAQQARIDQGDYAGLMSRRDSLIKYLEQAETLADLLRDNRTGRNYEVPGEIEKFEHLLCTPGVEWIWSTTDPRLWLDQPRMPRICLVEEMLNLLSGSEEDPVAYPKPV
jgi:hypothetical protein